MWGTANCQNSLQDAVHMFVYLTQLNTNRAERALVKNLAVNFCDNLRATWGVSSWLMTCSNVTADRPWQITCCGHSAQRACTLNVAAIRSIHLLAPSQCHRANTTVKHLNFNAVSQRFDKRSDSGESAWNCLNSLLSWSRIRERASGLLSFIRNGDSAQASLATLNLHIWDMLVWSVRLHWKVPSDEQWAGG